METQINKAIASILAASISLTFFWILNIAKEAFKQVKDFLNFYPPIGPLLGLFIFSLLVLGISYFLLFALKIKNQKLAFYILLICTLLFIFMVFPPFFHPIVSILK